MSDEFGNRNFKQAFWASRKVPKNSPGGKRPLSGLNMAEVAKLRTQQRALHARAAFMRFSFSYESWGILALHLVGSRKAMPQKKGNDGVTLSPNSSALKSLRISVSGKAGCVVWVLSI
jgi:hypothetical protein